MSSQWKEKLALKDDERLEHTGSRMKGSMEETDVDTYDVINAEGVKVGSVIVEDHMSIRGFARRISLCHMDVDGSIIFQKRWKV